MITRHAGHNITIHAGHNKAGKIACGASDYLDESTEARYMVKKICANLKKHKINTKNITVNNGTSQNDVLVKLVKKANNIDRLFDLSIHFNASIHSNSDGITKGIECILYPGASKDLINMANAICKNVSAYGLKNRGVKYNSKLYFLRKTNRPAMIIEVCFVDDQDDYDVYTRHKNDIAKAISAAIYKSL